MWVRAEFPHCFYRCGVTQVQGQVCQGTLGRPRWRSCPHSFTCTPQLHCTAAHLSYSREFSQQLFDKSYTNWRRHIAFPSSSAPAVSCSRPSTSRSRLMPHGGCRQPVYAGWPPAPEVRWLPDLPHSSAELEVMFFLVCLCLWRRLLSDCPYTLIREGALREMKRCFPWLSEPATSLVGQESP